VEKIELKLMCGGKQSELASVETIHQWVLPKIGIMQSENVN
jgi:hypothetical protein